jgi:hypothetical protein
VGWIPSSYESVIDRITRTQDLTRKCAPITLLAPLLDPDDHPALVCGNHDRIALLLRALIQSPPAASGVVDLLRAHRGVPSRMLARKEVTIAFVVPDVHPLAELDPQQPKTPYLVYVDRPKTTLPLASLKGKF